MAAAGKAVRMSHQKKKEINFTGGKKKIEESGFRKSNDQGISWLYSLKFAPASTFSQ